MSNAVSVHDEQVNAVTNMSNGHLIALNEDSRAVFRCTSLTLQGHQ